MTQNNSNVDYKQLIKQSKKDVSGAVAFVDAFVEETGESNESRILRSAVSIGLVSKLLSAIKTDKDTKEAAKQMAESAKVLEKQLLLLTTDETINKNEYSYKLLFSAIQGVNQAFHLYAIGYKKYDTELVEDTIRVLGSGENVYQISKELQKFARTKQNWAGK